MTTLTNLNGLVNLTTVGDYLAIYFNAALTNLNGLANLTTVGNNLVISSNATLCQDEVDSFVLALLIGGNQVQTCCGNNGTCSAAS